MPWFRCSCRKTREVRSPPADELVLQARHVRGKVGVPQLHDAWVLALLHDLVQHGRLVPQHLRCRRVQAELQRDALGMGHVRVLRLPDLAEAAHAEKFLQFPVADARRPVAGLETRRLGGNRTRRSSRPLQPQLGGHGSAARVLGSALGCPDGVGHLAEVGGQRSVDGFRLGRRPLPPRLPPHVRRASAADCPASCWTSSSFCTGSCWYSFQRSQMSRAASPPTPKPSGVAAVLDQNACDALH